MEGDRRARDLGGVDRPPAVQPEPGDRLAKHKPADKTIAEDPLKIAGFEETLAGLTREFTEGVEGIVGQRIEPLHAAEEAMLAAIAALDHGQNAQAPAHMAAALRHLIAARDTLRVLIGQDPAASKAMRSFDRMQAQKIRKPKKDEEEAEEIAEEIEQLAQDEDFVYATLAGIMMEQQAGQATKGDEAGKAEEDPEKKTEDRPKRRKTLKRAKKDRRARRVPGRARARAKARARVRARLATKASRTTTTKAASRERTNAVRPSSGKRRLPIRPASWKRS